MFLGIKSIGCIADRQAMADYLGAKKGVKKVQVAFRAWELVSEELQITRRTFVRHWSIGRPIE